MCGTSFEGAERIGAKSWVAGHDSAIACTRQVAERVGPRFTKVGPGEACSLDELREALDWLAGSTAEILAPADHIPALFLWTPPTREGWNREYLGAIRLGRGARFVAPREDAAG